MDGLQGSSMLYAALHSEALQLLLAVFEVP